MFSRCVGFPYSHCLWGSRSRKTYSRTVRVSLFLVSYYSSASGDSLILVNLSLKYSEKNEITTRAWEVITCNNCVAYGIAITFHAAFMITGPEMKAWNIQLILSQSISNQQPSVRALPWEAWGGEKKQTKNKPLLGKSKKYFVGRKYAKFRGLECFQASAPCGHLLLLRPGFTLGWRTSAVSWARTELDVANLQAGQLADRTPVSLHTRAAKPWHSLWESHFLLLSLQMGCCCSAVMLCASQCLTFKCVCFCFLSGR